MAGIGGTNMENRGIEYRERSPLVVPPKLDLPPPAAASAEVKAPNWPKDPDEARRKAAIAARKKDNKDPREASRVLTPSELDAAQDRRRRPHQQRSGPARQFRQQPDPEPVAARLSPAASAACSAATKPRPRRSRVSRRGNSLTQPPPGYQTPSPNFAYGTGPKESLNKEYNPAAGKYGE